MEHPTKNPYHDRLDLKMKSVEYSDKPCGSINVATGKPEFCDFECPTLHGKQPMPPPHWSLDPEAVKARDREIMRVEEHPSALAETTPGIQAGSNLP